MGDYLDHSKPLGENVKRLFSLTFARMAVPLGSGVAGAMKVIESGKMPSISRQAMHKVEAMLSSVKAATDNPYGNDDEVIAAELLKRLDDAKEKPL